MDVILATATILIAQCTGPYCGPDAGFERPNEGVFGAAGAPAVDLARDGTLYVAWESRAGGESDVFFNRREPAAEEWSAPRRLDTDEAGAARSLEVRLVAGPERRVYTAWQDARHGRDDIYFNCSTDGGATWLANDVRIDSSPPGASTSSMTALAADATGRVYLAWEDLRHGERDIYFSRSTDHGVSWESDRRVDSDAAGTAVSYHPQIVAWDEGTVLVCWWDERDGYSDLYVRRSVDGGVSWTGPERRIDEGVPGKSPSHDARVSVAGDRLVVAWEEGRSGSGASVVVRTSDDRGDRWGPVVVYGTGTDAVPHAREDGPAYLAWVSRDARKRIEKTSIGGRIVEIGPPVLLHASHGKNPGDSPTARSLSQMDGPGSVWIGGASGAIYTARTGTAGGRGIVEVFESREPWPGAAAKDWIRHSILPFGSELLFTDQDVRAHSLRGVVTRDGTLHLVWVAEYAGIGNLGHTRVDRPPSRDDPGG
jgi:hypothetical protein